MSDFLLSTKLFTPAPRPNRVDRERLIRRLDDGLKNGRALILVSAPAGFGKTTLVSDWLHQLEPTWPVAWVSLDEGDNDPVLFLRYLIAGLQKVDVTLGETLLPRLAAAQLPPLTELGALLINELAQAGVKPLLVLDDYHRITSADIHTLVQLLVEHQPGGLHTLLLTREDPPFPLPRLRARGQMTEIRERDLRFSLVEAEIFFSQTMGLDLPEEWVSVLETHIEGWAAGLQLAALAVQESPDEASIQQFLQVFTGSGRYVGDYLLDEVYTRLPAEIQEFLLRSAIVERLSAPLCDQLLDVEPRQEQQGRSSALLQQAERANLFLNPLDNERTWYRYHHLFAELLQHRLQQEKSADFLRALHRAASGWYEGQGYLLEAARHAFQTHDWDFAAGLVERSAMTLLSRSQMSTVLDWYSRLPEKVLKERPLACIYMAWTLVLAFREDYRPAVEEWLHRAERALLNEDLPQRASIGPGAEPVNLHDFVTGQVCIIRSQNLLASFREPVDPQNLIDLSQRALELLPETAQVERSVCVINLALVRLILSQAVEAEVILEEAYQAALAASNYFGAVTMVWYQARLAFYTGQIARAEDICLQGQATFRSLLDHPEQNLPAIRSILVVQAMMRLEQNQLEPAEELLEQALDLTGWASWVELWAFASLVRLRQAQGDPAGALQTLERMEKMGPQHAICAQALRAVHHVRAFPGDAGLSNRIRLWLQAHPPDLQTYGVVTGLGPYHCDSLYLKDVTWAQLQVALGQPHLALAFIDPVLAVARQHGLTYRMIELLVIQAMALDAAGDGLPALAVVQEALALAEPHDYLRVFDQGPALDRLLMEATRRGTSDAYIQRLAAAFNRPGLLNAAKAVQAKAQSSKPIESAAHIEPLSEREDEVLRLIAAGHSNAEIAAQLVIALGTVKRHINNIYGKLGVKSRTQAVEKARQTGLLP